MANGKTIVFTRVVPDVLISIGKIQCRSCLIVVPMMEGFNLILGKDWLDMVNPLVDRRNNRVSIRSRDQLHCASAILIVEVRPCVIKD